MTPDCIRHIRFREVVRPLRVFFATSLGGKDKMRSLIVDVMLEDGSSGSGECPTSAAFPLETIPAMKGLLAEWAGELKGLPVQDGVGMIPGLRKRYPHFPMAISGLETALFRASLRREGQSEHSWWGGKSKEIETDITIPFIPGHPALLPWLEYTAKRGFGVFKVKVSGRLEEDTKFLSGLFDYLGEHVPGFTVRLDGNQGYTVRSFLQMTDWIRKKGFHIELFEQPLPRDDFAGLREITKYSPVPVILDETVVNGEQLARVIGEGTGHGVNIKIAKSGIYESLNILTLAKEAGLKLMMGCMTETMVGLSAGIYLAAGSDAFDYIDLDGVYFLHHRNRYEGVEIRSPRFLILD